MGRWGFLVVVALLVGCTRLGFDTDAPADDSAPPAEVGPGPDGPTGKPDGSSAQDGPSNPDSASIPDSSPPDLPPPDLPPSKTDIGVVICNKNVIGKVCSSSSQCGANGFCLIVDKKANHGFCSCPCSQDDPQTPLINEDSCPDLKSQSCGNASTLGTSGTFCFRFCTPKLGASDCASPLVCLPGSGMLVKKLDKSVCTAGRCTTGKDCPVYTSKACTGPGSCASGEACLPLAAGVPYKRCTKPGTCDVTSGLCGLKSIALSKATAKVGDPCNSDLDCGTAMFCRVEIDTAKFKKKQGAACNSDTQCCSGTCQGGKCTIGLCTVMHRNGYCSIKGCSSASTLTIRTCPSGSTCNHMQQHGGQCQRLCSPSSTASCRGHSGDMYGDYECRAWDKLSYYNMKVANAPVCDFGPGMPCSLYPTISCTAVGLNGNPTNMSCRSLAGKLMPNPKDPTGFCLDNTPSGTIFRSPLPTP